MLDLSTLPEYKDKEELLAPDVCFRVPSVEFDYQANKHVIIDNYDNDGPVHEVRFRLPLANVPSPHI